MASQRMTSLYFLVPNTVSLAEARTWAYLQLAKDIGPGDDLPEGISVLEGPSGQVKIKYRDPACTDEDWPEGTVWVLAQAVVVDNR